MDLSQNKKDETCSLVVAMTPNAPTPVEPGPTNTRAHIYKKRRKQTQGQMTRQDHLVGQDGQRSLQAASRVLPGGPGQPLGIVAHLRPQRGDVANDLLGPHHILGHIHNGLGAGEGAAAPPQSNRIQVSVPVLCHTVALQFFFFEHAISWTCSDLPAGTHMLTRSST